MVDDPRPAEPARAGLLIRLLATLLWAVLYPLLALRRWRAAPRGAWVELEIDGRVPELPAPHPLLARLARRPPRLTLLELRALVSEIVSDERPRGLLITLRAFDGGMATAMALRHLLGRVRKAGRKVVVHAPAGLDTKSYFVACAADKVYAFPAASVALLGFASRGVYLREALAKVGLVADVLAHGKYKSAGDALTRDAMSEPQREQVTALLDVLYEALAAAVRESRSMTAAEATAAIDRGIYRAPEAVRAKLLDASLFDDQVLAALEPDRTDAPACVSARSYLRARVATNRGRGRRPCVGVIEVHGAIVQGGGSLTSRAAVGHAIVAAVRAAREDRRVRGVILHIDSPGGSALASAQMHRELELLASEKPLVALMANVAASGGYDVAAPAQVIVAEPLTVTGSIGVISARFALGPLLERLGVHVDMLKRGERADLFDAVRPLEPGERAALLAEIEGTYQEFVEVVARGRKKSTDEIEALAQGRVWAGVDAHARGLVDILGGFDVALEEVRRRVGGRGEMLEARILRVRKSDPSLRSAKPSHPEVTWLADQLLGDWADMVPLALGSERVLAWSPTAATFR